MSMLVDPFAASGGGVSDPYFSSVVLLCHLDGTNGSQTYTDHSLQAHNPTGGSAESITTTGPLFGTGALQGAGSTGISATAIGAYPAGAGDFCWEFAFNASGANLTENLCDCGGVLSSATTTFVIYTLGNQFIYYQSAANKIVGGTVTAGTWQRVAAYRLSGTTYMAVDGAVVGSYSDSVTYTTPAALFLGQAQSGAATSAGKFDEWRYTVGQARYTGAGYTPAVAAFPNS